MFTNVGFVGSRPIAQALAHHLVAAQIPVCFSNSRGPSSLTEIVAELGDPAEAVTVEQAVPADPRHHNGRRVVLRRRRHHCRQIDATRGPLSTLHVIEQD